MTDQSSVNIYTYHCLCSHLVIATTRSLESLPRRRAPGLDKAYIVPLPPPPRSTDSDSDSEDENDVQANDDPTVERMEIDNRSSKRNKVTSSNNTDAAEDQDEDYTLLLSSVRDRRACIIRREDGFEKRLLWRCGRCRLIFGYQIADEVLEEQEKEQQLQRQREDEGDDLAETSGSRRKRQAQAQRRKKGYVYILPGGVTSGEEMGTLGEKEVAISDET